MQRATELRCSLSWPRIAHILAGLQAVRYQIEGRTIVLRTKISSNVAEILKDLGTSTPKKLLSVNEPAPTHAAA